jgi:hypothetical protein
MEPPLVQREPLVKKTPSKRSTKNGKPPAVAIATPTSGRNGRLNKQQAVWTEAEILVLVEAKSTLDEAIAEDGGARTKHTAANVKWDEVEDYCFNNGFNALFMPAKINGRIS